MSIRRSPRRQRYAVINQAVFEDTRLDHRALGVLTYLLSKPDNWKTNSHQLAERFSCNVTTIKGILSALEEFGYLLREKHRRPDGTFYWESTVFEVPTMGQKTSDGKTSDGKTSDGKTSDGKTSDGKLAPITNNEVTITELTKTDHDQADDDFSGKPDPFYTGQARQIAREVVSAQRQFNGVRNFITDAPWGVLAKETGKDPTTIFHGFEGYLKAVYSDKKDPDAYAKKICSGLYEKPGSELACKPWLEFADFFRKNLTLPPPPPKKREARQPKITPIPDREASVKALKEAKHGLHRPA